MIRKYAAGNELKWGGTIIRVLSPPADWQPKAQAKNDDSLALRVCYGDTSALLAGDLVEKMERFVATESPAADLLKVAHHGSATSTTSELLAAVHPKFAVTQWESRQFFRPYRGEWCCNRLQASHVRTYRTDIFGAVTFLLDKKQVQAHLQSH